MHESTSWTLHPTERVLQKPAEATRPMRSYNPTLQSKWSLAVSATDSWALSQRRHRPPRGTTRAHSVFECRAHHDRHSRSREIAPKASSPSTLDRISQWRHARSTQTRPNCGRRRARLPLEAGRERRTPLAGYRESTTQIMMSKVDRTNALYYVVNVPNIPRRDAESCIVSAAFLRFVTNQLNICSLNI